MKKLTALLMLLIISSCSRFEEISGNGKMKSEIREASGVTQIESDGDFVVLLAQGKKNSAEITADENILPAIKTEKKGSTLIISRRQNFKCQNAPVISVTLKTAEKISISGKTELLISGVLKGKDIEIYAKKNSEVRGKFRFTSAVFNLQGKSYVLADGYCGKLAIINAGDGFFDGRKLSSGECSIDTAGRLEAMISAEQKLSIKSFGGIELFYAGKPKVKKSVSGDAKIHRVKTFAKIPVTP